MFGSSIESIIIHENKKLVILVLSYFFTFKRMKILYCFLLILMGCIQKYLKLIFLGKHLNINMNHLAPLCLLSSIRKTSF